MLLFREGILFSYNPIVYRLLLSVNFFLKSTDFHKPVCHLFKGNSIDSFQQFYVLFLKSPGPVIFTSTLLITKKIFS